MKRIDDTISIIELKAMSERMYGTADFIEFDSMINIRPRQQNPSRDVLEDSVRKQIIKLVSEKVHE